MAGVSAGEEVEPAARAQNTCFVCGTDNPRGLHIRFQKTGDGVVEAQWRPPSEVEGYQGIVHGGVVAAVLDEAMSKAVAATGSPALTAHLEVRYRRPVPGGAQYRIEGEVARRDLRRLHVRGALVDAEGNAFAESKACFVRKV